MSPDFFLRISIHTCSFKQSYSFKKQKNGFHHMYPLSFPSHLILTFLLVKTFKNDHMSSTKPTVAYIFNHFK